MAARNEHTCKMITTAIVETTDAYRDGWERIFGKPKCEHPPQQRRANARTGRKWCALCGEEIGP